MLGWVDAILAIWQGWCWSGDGVEEATGVNERHSFNPTCFYACVAWDGRLLLIDMLYIVLE